MANTIAQKDERGTKTPGEMARIASNQINRNEEVQATTSQIASENQRSVLQSKSISCHSKQGKYLRFKLEVELKRIE